MDKLSLFLSSLKPNMIHLVPTFRHAGILDDECLQAVVELPEKERTSFVDDLRLNLLQSRVIQRGLTLLHNKSIGTA